MVRTKNESLRERDIEVLGIGALNLDRLLRVRSLAQRDTEMVSLDEVVTCGGSAANTLFALARLGVATAQVGVVGADEGGRRMIGDLSNAGVITKFIASKRQRSTGESICISDHSGRRMIVLHEGANGLLATADVSAASAIAPKLVHLTSFVGDAQLGLQVAYARASNAFISLSPGALYSERGIVSSARRREDIGPLADCCDLLFVNRREISALMGTALYEYPTAARMFLEKFDRCKTVVVTLGGGRETLAPTNRRTSMVDRGRPTLDDALGATNSRHDKSLPPLTSCYVVSAHGEWAVKFVESGAPSDGTGAGDAFAAGYLYGHLRGRDPGECALYGHTLAQFSVMGIGARGHLPTLAELELALGATSARVVTAH